MIEHNPKEHTYFLDGKEIPSVTRILKDERWIDTRFYTEEGRDRGTNVHFATALLDGNALDWRTVDPVIVGYVESWEKCRKDLGLRITGIERIVHLAALYGGKVDREALWEKRKTVIDLKTGSPNRADNLQITAYGATYKQRPRLLLVYLKPDGYRISELEPEEAEVYSLCWHQICSLWHFRRQER